MLKPLAAWVVVLGIGLFSSLGLAQQTDPMEGSSWGAPPFGDWLHRSVGDQADGEEVLVVFQPGNSQEDDMSTMDMTRPQPQTPPSRSRRRRRSSVRLTRAPYMFGDFFGAGTIGANTGLIVAPFVNSSLPLAGGSRRVKVSENNKALTQDRVFFAYNHFHNAQSFQRFDFNSPVNQQAASSERYTLGLEKTFADGCWSVELRMPFSDRFDYGEADFSVRGGQIGDLAIITKKQLYRKAGGAVVAGVGLTVPTGSDVSGQLPLPGRSYLVKNEAVHLLPYVGVLGTPNSRYFWSAFAQVDTPTHGHRVTVTQGNLVNRGRLNEQTLLMLDVNAGVWLYDDPCGCRVGLRGVAAMVELHYTTTLSDADTYFAQNMGFFASPPNRYDVVNLTAGLNFQVGTGTDIRIGGVVPLDEGENRFFDAEVTASAIRRF